MLRRLQRQVAGRLAATLIVAAMAAAIAPAPAPGPRGHHLCQCPSGAHDCHCPVCSRLVHGDASAGARRASAGEADAGGRHGPERDEPSRVTSACRLPDDARPPGAREPFTVPASSGAVLVEAAEVGPRPRGAALELARRPEVPPPRGVQHG